MIPQSTREKILPHQQFCLDRAINELGGKCLITLAMGGGKTMVGCILAHMQHRTHSLILVPKNKLNDWQVEFKRWLGYSLVPLKQHRGDPPQGIVITTISTAREWLKNKKQYKFDCIVVDEAHALKGSDSIQSRVIIPVLISSSSCFLLTGTPQLNRPSELYNLLHAVRPMDFNSRDKFIDQFCDGYMDPRFPASRNAFRETGIKRGQEDVLQRIMESVMCRPPLSYKLPKLVRHLVVKSGDDEIQKEVMAMKEAGRELAQQQRDALDQKEYDIITQKMKVHANMAWIRAGQLKAEVFGPYLDHLIMVEHGGEGVVLFCVHLETANTIHERLRTMMPDVSITTGKSSDSERLRNITDLALGKVRVGVMSVGVGGVGINLVPNVSCVVFVELPQVPEYIAQAECRAHRMGQTREVSSYWLKLDGSRDEEVMQGIMMKKESCSAALGETGHTFEFDRSCAAGSSQIRPLDRWLKTSH